nr:hypothetical protein [Tanacetum cinerariifolium]
MDDSIGVLVSLGEISLEGNKYWESNIGDSDNSGDGGKIVGRAITTWGGGMVSYACMTSIFKSSCKGEKTSMSKIYLVKLFEESGEMLPEKIIVVILVRDRCPRGKESLRILFEQRIAAIKGYRGGSGGENYHGGCGGVIVVPRLIWRKRKRGGHFKDQEMDFGACKQLVGEGGESLRVVQQKCGRRITHMSHKSKYSIHLESCKTSCKKPLRPSHHQAIQTILLGLLEDIYAAVNSCETAQEIWLRVQQMMKGSDIETQEKKANLFNEWEKNVRNQNGLIVVPEIANQNPVGNGNVVATRDEDNANGNNGNQIRCYNCRGLGHIARNCTVRPRRRDATYLQTQLLIAQKEEAGIQLQAEEFYLMAATTDLDKIEEVNANCILMANLQQASTSDTQTDKALVYDPDGSAENDSNVIYEVSSVEQSGRTVEQHPKTVEETHTYHESLFHNLAAEVEKVNTVNRKMKETNAELTTELARYKNQEKCFEISQEKYDKLERGDTRTCLRESLKMKQLNKEIKPENYTKINHHSRVFVSQMAKSLEELYFLNTSKSANVSKSISIPNKEFWDDTTPSVARKFLNGVESTIVTLQRVVKQKMTLDIHNWSSSVHQEIHKIVKDEIFPIVNQVDARVPNFEIQFLKEAAKFVRDFKSLTNEADESFAKHKALELEIKRLLRAFVSQDIMSIMLNPHVETSNL